MAAGVYSSILMLGFFSSVRMEHLYGLTMFGLSPLLGGFVSALVLTRGGKPLTIGTAVAASLTGNLAASGLAYASGGEGFICIVMALGVLLILALLGLGFAALLNWIFGGKDRMKAAPLALLIPFAAMSEGSWNRPFEDIVISSVVIDAPPAKVWPYLSELHLPPPKEALFRMGVAYPTEVKTQGRDRQCILSTGAMTERIEVFEPGRRLRFKVLHTPPSMKESSPYDIHPMHLENYFSSREGEFELVALPDGRTLLTGRSTYDCAYAPEAYWRFWTRKVVRDVQLRVMEEIKRQAEDASRF